MREYLKVKVKSLSAEAKIIRHEELKAKRCGRKSLLFNLREHRIGVVRRAARSSLLAYGFLKGTPYRKMEKEGSSEPDWDAVQKMIERYGGKSKIQPFCEWKA